ncbi:MAG: 50S ribosomal protein L13 [Arsenophonus endosymbiont of Ceratovacuna japonica]
MKTFISKSESIKRYWYIIDAEGQKLGRVATKIANYLRGKHKIEYTPYVDTGDYIIIINAEKVIVTGNKYKNKIYYRHSGYVGGIKKESFKEMITSHPNRIIEIAVKGMLPKGPLGRSMYRKMKVYTGNYHNHKAQQPKILNI